ncbi:HEAT repeat domain-containing protein [Geothrix sp. 21YS21S-4]|uniref:HEAT repeat domain-containing protein n=1 Tax=Geothrix sp. 21YS21S-4 TaxID=3068889 RepID=UPI0027B98100|nr:HEAT repeat domain-containing protein [Geothrix sp. 21YS21S-4]
MAVPLRHMPVTPLDELRGWLANSAESDATSQARLHQLLQQLRQLALPELGGRLVKPTSSIPLKRLILGLTARFDWPEWTPWIQQALQQEPDLGVFDEGCAALGRLELRPAREALEKLAAQRTDPDRQLILRRELGAFESHQAVTFYLGRLLEGEGNPRLAHQGARGLAAAEPEDFPELWEAVDGADALAFRLLLRAVAELPGGAPGSALLHLFGETLRTLEDLGALETLTQRIQGGARTAARTELMQALAARMEGAAPEEVQALQVALAAGETGQPGPPLDRLRDAARGPYETFLVEALAILVEGKVARFTALVAETQDTAAKQWESRSATLNQICEALLRQVGLGHLPLAEVLPVLEEAFSHFPDSRCLDYAFCRLVPAGAPGLAAILKVPDPKRRVFCLDVLGAREEDALVPFFLQAMGDEIVEVGHRAIHHFGKLPSSFPAVMDLFRSGQMDHIRTALRIFAENGTKAAAEPLMEFLVKPDVRDDLLIEGVEALGAIRSTAAAPVLLDLLHDGKPARLQEALAEALAALATPEAGLGLLAKSVHLKLPQVLLLALEGALAAFPSFGRPFPPADLPALEQLITRCCDDREGEGRRLQAILSTQNLYCFDQAIYLRLKDAFSDFLFELRTKAEWDRETNDRVAAVVKELGRRSASLGHIAGKEERIRTLVQNVPAGGPTRAPALLGLRDALQDPEFILRPELAEELAAFVLTELGRREQDWRELARVCELAGLIRWPSLIEPLKELFQRATGLGLRSAARLALLALGLEEADISRRAPIHTILLLEPSAFFRKRLLAALGAGPQPNRPWEIREAGSRTEAAPLLEAQPVDLLISEQTDPAGDLRPWLKAQWEAHHCRHVLLSTAARDTAPGEPWILDVLYKPYPPEQLLKALEA